MKDGADSALTGRTAAAIAAPVSAIPDSRPPERDRVGLGIALVVAVVYLPVCFGHYAVSDDYTWLWSVTRAWDHWPEFFAKYWSDGRPVVFLDLLLLKATASLDLIWLARVPALVGTAALGWRIWCVARRTGWARPAAAAVALTIGCMPAFQVTANWVICASFVYGCLATEWAVHAMWEQPGRRPLRWATAILAVWFAFLCFQPAGCFVWVWTALRLAASRDDLRAQLHRLGCVLIVFMVAGALAYLVLRTAPATTSRAALTTDLPRKIYWFLRNPLLDALALTSAMHRPIGWLLTGCLLALAAIGFARGQRPAIGLVLIVPCVPLSYLANLAIAECWSSYRTALALGPCVAILIWGAYEAGFGRASGRSAGIRTITTVVLVGVAGYQMIWGYTLPQTREWRHLETQVAALGHESSQSRLELRLADHDDAVGPSARYDEFGVPSSLNEWALRPMVQLAFRARSMDTPPALVFLPSDARPPEHGIDMRGL